MDFHGGQNRRIFAGNGDKVTNRVTSFVQIQLDLAMISSRICLNRATLVTIKENPKSVRKFVLFEISRDLLLIPVSVRRMKDTKYSSGHNF